jgi:hypothetical protein
VALLLQRRVDAFVSKFAATRVRLTIYAPEVKSEGVKMLVDQEQLKRILRNKTDIVTRNFMVMSLLSDVQKNGISSSTFSTQEERNRCRQAKARFRNMTMKVAQFRPRNSSRFRALNRRLGELYRVQRKDCGESPHEVHLGIGNCSIRLEVSVTDQQTRKVDLSWEKSGGIWRITEITLMNDSSLFQQRVSPRGR